MGSDKFTKKLGQFIALGALASASLAYAADATKPAVAPTPVAAKPADQGNTAKPEAMKKEHKVKHHKSHEPAAKKTTTVSSTK